MTGRMLETAKHYLEGDSKGNLTQSMLKGGYAESYAKTHGDTLARNSEFKKALEQIRPVVEKRREDKVEQINQDWDKLQATAGVASDRTTVARCLENKGKIVGIYELDNKQKTEQRQLTEKEADEARRMANIRLREGVLEAAG